MKDELDYCDAGKIQPILARAKSSGMTPTEIAAELGLSTNALRAILDGDVMNVKPATARAVRRMDRRLK